MESVPANARERKVELRIPDPRPVREWKSGRQLKVEQKREWVWGGKAIKIMLPKQFSPKTFTPLKSCYYRIINLKKHDFKSDWNPIPILSPSSNVWVGTKKGPPEDFLFRTVFLVRIILFSGQSRLNKARKND